MGTVYHINAKFSSAYIGIQKKTVANRHLDNAYSQQPLLMLKPTNSNSVENSVEKMLKSLWKTFSTEFCEPPEVYISNFRRFVF